MVEQYLLDYLKRGKMLDRPTENESNDHLLFPLF